MKALRKLLSMLLLAIFSFLFLAPLFALAGPVDGGVPMCCRRNGTHHCQMSMADRADAAPAGVQLRAPVEKCPFAPCAMPTTHQSVFSPGVSASVFAALVRHPADVAQTESKRRISRDRARQKRGPPSLLG